MAKKMVDNSLKCTKAKAKNTDYGQPSTREDPHGTTFLKSPLIC